MLIKQELIRCELCGSEILKMAAAQKYCKECAAELNKKRSREAAAASKRKKARKAAEKSSGTGMKNVPKIKGQSRQLCEDVHCANLLGMTYGEYMGNKLIYRERLTDV